MRFPVPTALGIKAAVFYVVLFGAFFAAPYSNLYFLLLVFLTVLGLMSFFWTTRNLSGAMAEVEEPAPAPAGAGLPFRVGIDAGRRVRYGLGVNLTIEEHGVVSVRGGAVSGESALSGRLPALPRGIYRILGADLVSTWPLGLLRARRRIEAFEELVVYPAPADLPESVSGRGGLGEILGACGAPEGLLQPSSLREYVPGDELRRVHWKASARRGELVITEWEGGLGAGVEVVLDRRTDAATLEHALGVLSALALAAREEKELLTLHTQGLSATFGSEHRRFRELLRFLAGAEALPSSAPAPAPVSPGVLRLPAVVPAGGGR
ncbi:MAG: DUF58 domain-containing protein [Planctomycetota bacterium]